ncbi:MAG: phosphodiester glycosidase family protein [Bacilli bacterium]
MKKAIKTILTIYMLLLLTVTFGINNNNISLLAATNTNSEYVNTVTDLKTTDLMGGVTLYEQKMTSLLNGDSQKAFQEHFVQWVDLKKENDVRIVTWTKQKADNWAASTTREAAIEWEKYHPGWVVVAGTNGDFFSNSGANTKEPTTNYMQEGDMFRSEYSKLPRSVIGFKKDGSYIVGEPKLTENMLLHIYAEDGSVLEKIPISGYNTAATSDGITLYTKDCVETYDLTGYTVCEGTYTICRVANTKNKSVFIKGEMNISRAGNAEEKPCMTREELKEDGTTKTTTVREFYIATKNQEVVSKLKSGVKVKCQYDFVDEWADVINTMGYKYDLLLNGKSQHQKSTNADCYTDHPRTFIGFKEDGTPVLMVIDGRGSSTNPVKEGNCGVSLFEGAEIMKLAGCVNAYNLDGGGSSTLIARNENGGFDVINRPSDYGYERSTGNAIFLVMRDPAVETVSGRSSASTISIKRKTTDYAKSVTDIKVTVNGKTYEMESDEVIATGLLENTVYDVNVEYKLNGELCKSSYKASTNMYDPGVDINPTSKGFNIGLRQSDENLITSKVTIRVEDQEYVIENSEGKLTSYEITGLFKDDSYRISYTYEVTIKETGEKYTRSVEEKEYRTLSYDIPEIKEFSIKKRTGNKATVNYTIEDVDGLIKKMYLVYNGEKVELEIDSNKYQIEELDMNKVNTFKLVVEYETPDGKTKEIESDELTLGEEHVHEWVEATCTAPKTCKTCGATEGEALGHDWKEATTEAPKTCTRCGATEGEKLPTEKPKKNCKKSSLTSILVSLTVVAGCLVIRRKHN